LGKPGLIGIVQAFQVIGAHVGEVSAVAGNNAQIHETAGPEVYDLENGWEVAGLEHILKTVSVHYGGKDGGALTQEDIHRVAVRGSPISQLLINLLLVNAGELPIDSTTEESKGDKGHQEGEEDDLPLEACI
jgi:hypothetical protein